MSLRCVLTLLRFTPPSIFHENRSTRAHTSSPITANSLAAGSYFITVTDSKGCQASGTITIGEPEALQFVNCPGNYTATCDSGQNYATVTFTAPTASANANNNIGDANQLSLLVTYPDSTTAAALPTDDHYPVGVTTIAYTLTNRQGDQTFRMTNSLRLIVL